MVAVTHSPTSPLIRTEDTCQTGFRAAGDPANGFSHVDTERNEFLRPAPPHVTAASVCREFSAVARRSPSRQAALTEMVRMIANQLEVDACSLFRIDEETGDLVLAATMGLHQSSVGLVRLHPSLGLIGLVFQELQPVAVENAPEHPRFQYIPDAGEDPYVSFFGVPVLIHGAPLGVLVVQTIEPRDLSSAWAIVATAAQRIAPFVMGSMQDC